jgi:polar amino acid transport system substrate-binding protein
MKSLLAVMASALLTLPAARAQPIHVVTETSPYAYLQDGKPAGPATEIVELSLRKAGLTDYRINVYPWARSYDMALKEPQVLIYLIARTPARESAFKWVGEFVNIRYHFFRLKERTDIAVRTLDDARAYSVGVVRDDVRHQYLQSKGFTKLVVSGMPLDNFRKLLNRQVQLVALPDLDAHRICQEAQFDCANLERLAALDDLSSALYMAYSLGTPDAVVERTRIAFDRIKAEGVVRKAMDVQR